MTSITNQIYIEPLINGYKVNNRVDWYDNEYVFTKYEDVLEYLKGLDLPYREFRNKETEDSDDINNDTPGVSL